MKREVQFYRTEKGECPVEEFLDSLPAKVAQKITWVLKIIEEFERIPKSYFKKIESTEVYECRIIFGGNIYRILGFFYKGNFVVLTNGFQKKTQKTPKDEIRLCETRMKNFVSRGGKNE
jgi:phage-related protein